MANLLRNTLASIKNAVKGDIEFPPRRRVSGGNPSVKSSVSSKSSYKLPKVEGYEDIDLDQSPDKLPDADTNTQYYLDYVNEQFRIAAECRVGIEIDSILALAFAEGRQWLGRTLKAQEIRDLRNDQEINRYFTINLIEGYVSQVEAILTQSSPDVQFLPLTDRPEDKQAAGIAGAIHDHYSALYDRPSQTKERVGWALKSLTCFLKLGWDEEMERRLPILDENVSQIDPETGQPKIQIAKTETISAGGVSEEVIPGFEVYLDPMAKTWKQVRYLIHATVKPLGWFDTKFPKTGDSVQADYALGGGTVGYVDSYLRGGSIYGASSVSPTNMLSANLKKNAAVYYEYWELPNAERKDGLYLCCTKDVMLYAGKWPYKKRDSFPFVPLGYQPRAGTPYHMSLSESLMSLQMAYNRLFSSTMEQYENEIDYEVAPDGSGVGPDGFETRRQVRTRLKLTYNPAAGPPPQIYRAPGLGVGRFQGLDHIEGKMADVAGIHAVSEGQAPAGTPAEAVNLLQKADQSRHSRTRVEVERSAREIAQWEVAIETEKAPAPFMMAYSGIAGIGDPTKAATGLQNIQLLQDGGNFHIAVIAGSAFKETPQEEVQEGMGFMQAGIFGPPGSPAASLTFLQNYPVKNKEKLIAAIQEQMQQAQQKTGVDQKIIDSLVYQYAPPDIQRQIEQAGGLQPSQTGTPPETGAAPGPSPQEQMAVEQAKTQGEKDRATHQSMLDINKAAADHEMGMQSELLKHHLNQQDIKVPQSMQGNQNLQESGQPVQ